MNKIFYLAALLLFLDCSISAQSLDAEWGVINNFYNQDKYDSVIVYLPGFIAKLKAVNQPRNLFVAYLCLGNSYNLTNRFDEGDSVFNTIAGLAYENNLVVEYKQKAGEWMLSLYRLAKANENRSPELAIRLYRRVIDLSDTVQSAKTHIFAALDLTNLLLKQSRNDEALKILELSLGSISSSDTTMARANKAFISRLGNLYMAMGLTDKAKQLKEKFESSGDVDELIQLAIEAGKKGDYRYADSLLGSAENIYISMKDARSIEEFYKKRFELRLKLGEIREGLQILSDGIKKVSVNEDASKVLIFQLKSNLVALRNYYFSQVADIAGTELTDSLLQSMRNDLSRTTLPPAFQYRYYLLLGNYSFLHGSNVLAEESYRNALQGIDLLLKNEQLDLLNNLALACGRNGNLDDGIKYIQALNRLSASLMNDDYLMQSYLNMGVLLIRKSDYQEALRNLKMGRVLAQEKKNSKFDVLLTLRCAEVYSLTGYGKVANEMFEEVRHKYSTISDPFSKISILQSIAGYEKKAGNGETAFQCLNEALEIARANGLLGNIIPLSIGLADFYLSADSTQEAIGYYRYALSLMDNKSNNDDKILTILKIGKCFLILSQFDSARVYLNNVAVWLTGQNLSQILQSGQIGWSESYYISLDCALYAELQYFEGLEKDDYKTIVNAYESAKESVKLLEDNSLRNLQGREENNESVKLDSYRILIDIANYLFTKTSDKNYFETIYDASEQSRARSFVKEVGTQLIAKLNNPQAKQIATLAKLSKTGSEDFTMISNEQPVSRSVTRSGLKVVRDTSDKTIDTQNRYDALLKEIKGQNTKIANLVSANIPSVEGLSSLLQDNDALVDYYCSYSKTYLLFITKNAWKLIDLKTSPAEIQSIVEDYHRCLQNYTTREFEEVSSRLYTILLAPVNSEIKGKRLYIVPSGKLHNIPFGSLLTDGKFLAEINQICLLPNASAMQFVIRKDNNKKKPEWSMLAIGNPVNPEAVELLGAENEVNVINDIFPNTQVLLKYDATESAVKKYINNFDIVHFACHGIFNYEYPLLSALVLAPGDSDDGRLELHEIYNLDLVRTKLVVLSACQTGLAQIKKNDDMTGLVRGFLYAGVPSVIASLWQVDDQSTFILMTRFYYYLNQGFSKAESLQKAQIELIKSQDYSHPYFWSAFCLNGYGD